MTDQISVDIVGVSQIEVLTSTNEIDVVQLGVPGPQGPPGVGGTILQVLYADTLGTTIPVTTHLIIVTDELTGPVLAYRYGSQWLRSTDAQPIQPSVVTYIVYQSGIYDAGIYI